MGASSLVAFDLEIALRAYQNKRTSYKKYTAMLVISFNNNDPIVSTVSTDILFADIVNDLASKGYSIQDQALPEALTNILHSHVANLPQYLFNPASVGRESNQQLNEKIRNDKTVWIYGDSPAGLEWLRWTQALQQYLNRHLFMGLFSFESHFSHYAKGNYYKKHVDAFKGQANRVLSLVSYLNPDWQDNDGGELVIYTQPGDVEGIKVLPKYGSLVLFLSEDFEHEVKPAQRDRYSIAGWFRVNTSTRDQVDPPL